MRITVNKRVAEVMIKRSIPVDLWNQKKECSARRTSRKSSKIEEAMVVAERASEMAYQLMQQNPL